MTLVRKRRGFGLAREMNATPAISLDTKLVAHSEGWREESEAMPLVMKTSSH
jgi:hypothetical protein